MRDTSKTMHLYSASCWNNINIRGDFKRGQGHS